MIKKHEKINNGKIKRYMTGFVKKARQNSNCVRIK
jgi:hypothetical protein